MIIAFTSRGNTWESIIDSRFGRTEYLSFFDDEKNIFEYFDNRDIANEAHGAGPKTAQKLSEYKPDVLITGNGPGGNAARVLEQSGMRIFIGAGEMTVKQAFNAYKKNKLKEIEQS